MKRKVDVTLLGHRFMVRTEKDETYVHDLAAHVAQRIEDLRKQLRTASREELALLVALNMADEMFESAERSAAARAEVRRHTEAMIGKLTEALGAGLTTDERSDDAREGPRADHGDVHLSASSLRGASSDRTSDRTSDRASVASFDNDAVLVLDRAPHRRV